MTEEKAKEVCDEIRQIAYELHVYLGVGYLEKVYENGLRHRLEKAGFLVQTQVPIQVKDEDGYLLGDYVADMIVDGLIIELKAVTTLLDAHVAQLMNYLKATGLEHGLLLNFGSEKFQCKKFARTRI
ncbi:MAG: GxxExxY protein [Kiritimatiellae bacterium]|nr:GxxExxY protein [Kiritimatiellia bacterium]